MALYLAESAIQDNFQRDITHKNKHLPSISDLKHSLFSINVVTEMGQWWAGYVGDTHEASFSAPTAVGKEEEAEELPSLLLLYSNQKSPILVLFY